MAGPRRVFIYDGSRTEILKLSEVIEYIKDLLPEVEFILREESRIVGPPRRAARLFASIRIKDPSRSEPSGEPMKAEIDFELRRLQDSTNKTAGIIYDGYILAEFLRANIPEKERNLANLHIYITNQIPATYDRGDMRYHARYAIFSYPCIISTTGIVVAPAKPREYYIAKQKLGELARDEIFDTIIKEKMKARFIDYDDERINDVMKGIILQCIFYQGTGYPFCERKDCRLYNAHWQEDLIKSQTLRDSGLCSRHRRVLKTFLN